MSDNLKRGDIIDFEGRPCIFLGIEAWGGRETEMDHIVLRGTEKLRLMKQNGVFSRREILLGFQKKELAKLIDDEVKAAAVKALRQAQRMAEKS